MKKTCLVTGGAGFIGSHLVDRLIKEKYEVIVIDDLSNGKRINVNSKAVFHNLDISRNRKYKRRISLEAIFKTKKIEYVFHLAAQAKISECTDMPIESFKTNVLGTLYLLQLAKEYKVKGFIYSSSSSVYGEVKVKEPINEETLTKPISIYGLEKLQAEQLVSIYAPIYGVPTISLRYFNVYGTSRQRPGGAYPNVFSAFIRDNREKGKVTIYGNGQQVRDFIHVFDVVEANIKAMKAVKKGQVFNIGTGKTNSVNEIAGKLGYKAKYEKARQGDPKYSCADVKRARRGLGFKARIGLEDGIEILLSSYEK